MKTTSNILLLGTRLSKTTSGFALIDIKTGRKSVGAVIRDHKKKIPVTITGFITDQWSGDDGESIEFEIDVTSHKLGRPVKHKCDCIRCRMNRGEKV